MLSLFCWSASPLSSEENQSAFINGCALFVITVGLLVIIGWALGIDLLVRIVPAFAIMRFNTALGFVLAGFALWKRGNDKTRTWLGLLVSALGFLTLAEYYLNSDLGLDRFFILNNGSGYPVRMPHIIAFCFILSGLVLVLLNRRGEKWQKTAEAIGLTLAVISLINSAGYFLSEEHFFDLPAFKAIAFHTVLAFFILSLGFLAAIPDSIFSLLLTTSSGYRYFWQGLGVLIILLFAMGILALGRLDMIQDASTADIRFLLHETKDYLFTALAVGMVMALSAGGEILRTIHRRDLVLQSKNKELLNAQLDFSRAQNVAKIGWWRLDVQRNVLTWSPEAHRIFGVPQGTPLKYETFLTTVHPNDRDYVDGRWQAALQGVPYELEHRILADGQVKWVREKAFLEFDDDKTLLGGFGITQDITHYKEAETGLRESEERLRLAWKATKDVIWDWDVRNDSQRWSEAGIEVFGWRDVVDNPQTAAWWLERVHPDDQPRVKVKLHSILGDIMLDHWEDEYRFLRKNGEYVEVFDRGFIIRDAAGEAIRMIGAIRDMSAKNQSEREARENEARLQLALEAAKAGFWELAPATGEFIASDRFLTVHGLPPGTPMTYVKALYLIHPEDRPAIEAAMEQTLKTGCSFRVEVRIPQRDGGIRWIASNAELHGREDHPRLVGLAQDITDRKLAEEALRQSEERFRNLVESYAQAIWETDAQGMIVEDSPSWRAYTGQSREELLGEGWANAVHPDDRAYALSTWRETVARRQSVNAEFRLKTRSGVWRWTEVRATPIIDSSTDSSSKIVKWVGMNIDTDERKRMEETLRETRESLAIALEAAQMGVWHLDLAEDFSGHRSLRHDQIFGYETVQSNWSEAIARRHVIPEDRKIFNTAFADAKKTGHLHFDVRIRWPDGSIHWMAARGRFYFDENGAPVRGAGVNYDITEQKLAEEALREREFRLRLTYSAAAIGAWDWDIQHNRTHFNDQYYVMYGLTLGTPHLYEDFLALVHPDDREVVKANIEAGLKGTPSYKCEYRIIRPDNNEVRWFFAHGQFVYGENNTPLQALGVILDITERKHAEEKLQNYALKLEDADRRKNEFLAMLGHELRNPLTPISNVAQILASPGLDQAALDWARDMLQRNVVHITKLVDDLLDISRITRGIIQIHKTRLELVSLLHDAIEQVRQQCASKHQTLALALPDQPVYLEGDALRLTQAFANLLNNAFKYTGEGGIIELTAGVKDRTIWISIRDNGSGIEAALLPFIFDLFTQGERQLARSEGGLGIGLTLVKQIISLHGGSVHAVSAGMNQGAEFTVKLPRLIAETMGIYGK